MAHNKLKRSGSQIDLEELSIPSAVLDQIDARVADFQSRLTKGIHPREYDHAESAIAARESVRKRTEQYQLTLLRNKIRELSSELEQARKDKKAMPNYLVDE
jgi:ribosomal protein S15P/S13E